MAWLCVSDVLDKSLAGTGGLNLSGPCFILLSTMCSNLCTQAQCGHWCDYKTIGTGVEYENRLSREKPYMALAISLMWFNLEGGKKKAEGDSRALNQHELWAELEKRFVGVCSPSWLHEGTFPFGPFSVKSRPRTSSATALWNDDALLRE